MNTWYKSPINILSILSIIGGITYILYPPIIEYAAYISENTWAKKILQICMYSFLHGWWLHIVSNVIFFIFIGKIVEVHHGRNYVWWLWIWTTLFVGMSLLLLAHQPTLGWSGFAMALLSVYTLDFYKRGNKEYRWWITLIAINIVMWLYGNISLIGHLMGAIAWFMYGFIVKESKYLQK